MTRSNSSQEGSYEVRSSTHCFPEMLTHWYYRFHFSLLKKDSPCEQVAVACGGHGGLKS